MYHQTRFDTRSDGFRLIFSLCDCACVLMRLSLCPYADMHVSLCQYSRVLMLIYMRPYVTVCMSLHTTKHRSISHNRAINELRNLGLYPVSTLPTPKYPRYNNYVRVLYSYWVFYCAAEGYNKHHAMARQVLLYVFYAQPQFRSMILLM